MLVYLFGDLIFSLFFCLMLVHFYVFFFIDQLFVWYCVFFFFFFKQKTAYEMSISDWNSDVCSSDLGPMYSLWITGAFLLGVPLPLSQHILYLVACLAAVAATRSWMRRSWLSPVVFIILWLNPMTYEMPVLGSSEGRRVGKEVVSTVRFRWCAYHSKKNKTQKK